MRARIFLVSRNPSNPRYLGPDLRELVLIGVPREIPGCWISKSVILENILPERKGLWDTNTTFVAKHHWWWAAVDHTALWQSQYREWHQFLSMNVSWESRIPRRENWSQRNNHNYYCREVTSCSPLIQSDWFYALSLDRTVQKHIPSWHRYRSFVFTYTKKENLWAFARGKSAQASKPDYLLTSG